MLTIVDAQEALNKTIKIIERAKLDHIGGDEWEKERDRLFLLKDPIMETARAHSEVGVFNGLKVLETTLFIQQVVSKHDKMLASCLLSYLDDITGVYFL